jgi:SAM-dependent methyltransferase
VAQSQAQTVSAESKASAFTQARRAFWDAFAAEAWQRWRGLRAYYHQRLSEVYGFLIPPGRKVLEIGCGQGDLLASVRPARGVGIDFSEQMLAQGRKRYPQLEFHCDDAHTFDLGEKFDYVICSDLFNDVWDVQAIMENIARHSHPDTRIVLNSYSRVWEQPRRLAEFLGLAKRQLTQNWITAKDLENLLYLSGYETIRTSAEILLPVRLPLLDGFANKFLVRFWPWHWFALTYVLVARPLPKPRSGPEPIVTVVVAARNEEGNVPAIFDRVPDMGGGTELIFVEGNSKDDTYGAIEREMAKRQRPMTKLLKQPGKGKGDAVRKGFENATGELLMILDADLTVAPEDLPRFYEAWRSGKADFVNGVRLVYPMEEKAMKFFNHIGNRFFSLAFSWLFRQSIKDTLCGTKVLSKRDYDVVAANRAYFGDFDPFGDFDLLFGAAKYNLKIVDLPVRYAERTYGDTNIQRWRHGVVLLRMVVLAAFRLRFV